MAIKFPE